MISSLGFFGRWCCPSTQQLDYDAQIRAIRARLRHQEERDQVEQRNNTELVAEGRAAIEGLLTAWEMLRENVHIDYAYASLTDFENFNNSTLSLAQTCYKELTLIAQLNRIINEEEAEKLFFLREVSHEASQVITSTNNMFNVAVHMRNGQAADGIMGLIRIRENTASWQAQELSSFAGHNNLIFSMRLLFNLAITGTAMWAAFYFVTLFPTASLSIVLVTGIALGILLAAIILKATLFTISPSWKISNAVLRFKDAVNDLLYTGSNNLIRGIEIQSAGRRPTQ